jgi:hypothetical protein
MALLTSDQDNYAYLPKALYGFDATGDEVKPEPGYRLVNQGEQINEGDKPFDVYSGWIQTDNWHAQQGRTAKSSGRWTTWERKIQDFTPLAAWFERLKESRPEIYEVLHDPKHRYWIAGIWACGKNQGVKTGYYKAIKQMSEFLTTRTTK